MTPKAIADFLTPMVGLASAVVGLITAIVAITKYFNYRSRQDELRLVKQSFDAVVASLRSDSLVDRMSGAILLRRFYDSNTEMGVGAARPGRLIGRMSRLKVLRRFFSRRADPGTGGAPYWKVAVDVSAALLRGQTTSDFQKLLADGLAFAPNLIRADLQRTNLQFAYLGSRKIGVEDKPEVITDLRRADFYRADLSRASFKNANAENAVFYQARLHNTVFTGATLNGANFFDADIKGAVFKDATLYGADFTGARNMPAEIQAKLDSKGRYKDTAKFQPPPSDSDQAARPIVFVSKPGCMNNSQQEKFTALKLKLDSENIATRTLEREDYPGFGAAGEVRRVVSGCSGAVIFGFSELKIVNGTWRANTPEEKSISGLSLPTPWAQMEAGMAIMDGIPLLIVHQTGVEGGIFGLKENENSVYQICMDEDWNSLKSANAFLNWSSDVREQSSLSPNKPLA